jgi:hypothetical protein
LDKNQENVEDLWCKRHQLAVAPEHALTLIYKERPEFVSHLSLILSEIFPNFQKTFSLRREYR